MHKITHFISPFLFLLASNVFAGEVDINSADAQTIADNLKGIGLTKATWLVDYREANGPFSRLEDIAAVKGIGERTLDMNRHLIVIQ